MIASHVVSSWLTDLHLAPCFLKVRRREWSFDGRAEAGWNLQAALLVGL